MQTTKQFPLRLLHRNHLSKYQLKLIARGKATREQILYQRSLYKGKESR